MYGSRAAINRPVRNRRGRVNFMCISDYEVWTETVEGEEQMCTDKSVRELSIRV